MSGEASAADATAGAEPGPAALARARAHFQRGVALAARGDYTGAEKRFREALAIHYAPAVAYNLASAQFELRQYEQAYNGVQAVLADPGLPAEVRARAERLEQSLHLHVARLTVLVGSEGSDLTIQVDGERWEAARIGVPRALPPGVHVVRAERAGSVVSQRTVDIPVRTAALVDLSLLAPVAAPSDEPERGGPSLASAAPAQDERSPASRRRLWWLIGAGAVAVAGGVTLAVVLARREGDRAEPVPGDTTPAVLVWK